MSVVTIEIPERFTRSFGETDEEARRNAKLEPAIEMYREGKWSNRKAAEFAFGSMSFQGDDPVG